MIRVPARWACASAPVALVQINEAAVAICCIVAADYEAASWELVCCITMTSQSVATLVAQDFSPVERHYVCFLDAASSRRRRFVEAAAGSNLLGLDELRIQTPSNSYVAKTVILEGLRMSRQGSLERLFANLVGRYVFVGCEVVTEDGQRYRVSSVELQCGYRGLALVGATTRVKLNHKDIYSACSPHVLVGLDEQASDLQVVFRATAERPGSWIGVSVHASEDSGASSLIEHCTAEVSGTLVRWSPSGMWDQMEGLWNSRLVVLYIPSMDNLFSSSEVALSGLTARTLLRDIDRLTCKRNGVETAVVLVGRTCGNLCEAVSSIFSMRITIESPDVSTRAALLAHVRGGDSMDYMGEAHVLVGCSREAVLEIAQGPPRAQCLPIKPLQWSEIGGLNDVKERLRRALILPQLQQAAFARFNVVPPRGILLYGPPGCAKTSLVKALCSEGYFSLIYLDSARLISAYVGESEQRLRDVFRKAARQTPCIVFFDEVEVLGCKRELGSRDADQTRLLSTLLTEMDGFASLSGVCFVGATNTPHLLDSALLRPGRFDYLVHVPLPPRDDRRQILSLTLAGTSANLDVLADATEGFSGADLSSLSSGVLLELLEGSDEGCIPSCFHDSGALTDLLLTRVKRFHRTAYDAAALEMFHRDCSSLSGFL